MADSQSLVKLFQTRTNQRRSLKPAGEASSEPNRGNEEKSFIERERRIPLFFSPNFMYKRLPTVPKEDLVDLSASENNSTPSQLRKSQDSRKRGAYLGRRENSLERLDRLEKGESDRMKTPQNQFELEETGRRSKMTGDKPVNGPSFWDRLFKRKRTPAPRLITLNTDAIRRSTCYPANIIRNQKYHPLTFIFVVLYNQFKFFFNLYFLLVCLSQLVPMLRVTFLFTSIAPLVLVLTITISKEAYDDWKRYRRDCEANSQRYLRLTRDSGFVPTPSSELCVGDIIQVGKNERVPADMILLRSHDPAGSGTFLRTDQLDGETDWKLRLPVAFTQKLSADIELLNLPLRVEAAPPHKDIHSFIGKLSVDSHTEALGVEHTLWMNTVVAGTPILGMIIYTGPETRAVLNTSTPQTKVGLIEQELNRMTKVLCLIVIALAFSLVAMKGFYGLWIVYLVRFVVLFSTIIPLSLRVNLDLGKSVYANEISKDGRIPGVIVRTSTISEELGRIHYLLSDKTGTLTKNDMELRKLHLGTVSFSQEENTEIRDLLLRHMHSDHGGGSPPMNDVTSKLVLRPSNRTRRDIAARLAETIQGLALCHNVTPMSDGSYQAASPDEIAIVKWTEAVGVKLQDRDRDTITLDYQDQTRHYNILHCFPFTSESKRMGIIVKCQETGAIIFYQKGADAVMSKIVQANDWLDEECGNMAREGLRTLVLGRKILTEEQYVTFEAAHKEALLTMQDRTVEVRRVIGTHLECNLELLGLTGVEDKLQDDVKITLESLRQAGIRVWMLTGDKVETATCIAISSRLFLRTQPVIQVQQLREMQEAMHILGWIRNNPNKTALVLDGPSLDFLSSNFGAEFWAVAVELGSVVACRCTPTQKADVARAIKLHSGRRVCCIGDGGNDVSMIQAADVGVGIVGKEGRQASLAADFSVQQFSYLNRLLLWHGRNSYLRTAKVSHFVIHRGFTIAVMQAVFSSVVYFSPIALYQGLIAVGYTTVYTMFPVFSLVLDRDVTPEIALLYPELYRDTSRGRQVTFKNFFKWLLISTYQGGSIMIAAVWLFSAEFLHIVAITFTSLILNELLMVAVEITTWHPIMIIAELLSITLYLSSMYFLKADFDPSFVWTLDFWTKVAAITGISFAPLFLFKILRRIISPPSYAKLTE